ncbi:hypothetical protein CJ178_16610 [Rhodococcus sp. ACPA4]|nr:hypothetical protein CJ178_16610 [Rhodococcus sp. ACPA4]
MTIMVVSALDVKLAAIVERISPIQSESLAEVCSAAYLALRQRGHNFQFTRCNLIGIFYPRNV